MFERKRKLSDFTEEIEAHLQLEMERLREAGMSEEDARTEARRAFGNVTQARERFYKRTDGYGGTGYGRTFDSGCG